MTLPTSTLQRLAKIKSGLLEGKTIAEIALDCRVYEKTIDRDLRKWRQSKEFENWLKEEWIRLHIIMQKKDPTEAYRQLTKLIGHLFVRKIEKQIDVKEIKLLWIKHESHPTDQLQTT